MTENAKQAVDEQPELEAANGAESTDEIVGSEKIEATQVSGSEQESESGNDAAEQAGTDEGAETTAESDGGAGDESAVEEQDSELDLLKSERDELKDRFLRALAESENIRKIAEREKREASKFGTTRFARDMLAVHDNLLRALDAVDDEQRESSKALIEGIELTLRELLNAFSRHGIDAIEPKEGDAFDPNLHQAMFYAPVKDTRNGTIVNVLSKGFTIHERLLRAAQVGVSSFVQADESSEKEEKDSNSAN